MLRLVSLTFVLILMSSFNVKAVTEIKRYVIEGLPVFAVDYESNICDKYALTEFRKIQIEFGLVFANSALQCRFSRELGKSRQTAFLAIDPISKCALEFNDSLNHLYDSCSERRFDLTGNCVEKSCNTPLIQVYALGIDDDFKILEDSTTIVEFDGLESLQVSVEQKLAMAMINNSELTIDKILSGGGLDVDFSYQDRYSLVEIALKTREVEVLKYLLDEGAYICIDCKSMVGYLKNSLRSGSFNVSRLLLNQGVKPGEICDQLFFPGAKELIDCK